jgi:putative peptide zinc metalloprotease protein
MPLAANSQALECEHRVPLRRRPDLEVQRARYLGREQVVVKDPLRLKYYRFAPEEYALLEMFDGRSSFEQMQREFARRFAPRTISLAELQRLSGRLHGDSLILSDAPGQGDALYRRRAERVRRQWHDAFSNILCIRFPGVDPSRLLTWLDRWFGWLFSPWAGVLVLWLAASAALSIAVEFDRFRERLPEFSAFFGGGNWLWLAVALAATRVVHELGHGLACKHLGGECHRLGLMLVALAPCLYCDVSDSWMLPSKWRRIAVGLAGMYAELLLASLATYLWWYSHPGLVHYLCLDVMFICSVGTIAFNVNPLLRYDGYYVLSDCLEIPNLRQKADALLKQRLAAWTLGIPEPPASPAWPARTRWLLIVYAAAAAVYRWVVLLSVLCFLTHALEPYRLRIVGQLIAVLGLYGLLFRPMWQWVKELAAPGRLAQIRPGRLLVSVVIAGLVAVGVLCLPLPRSVSCPVRMQTRDGAEVYVEVPGRLQEIHVQPGDLVTAGQPLLTLQNPALDQSLTRLANQRRELARRLAGIRRQALTDGSRAADETEALRQTLAALDEQLDKRQRDLEKLQITAPSSGVILSPSLDCGQSPEHCRQSVSRQPDAQAREVQSSPSLARPASVPLCAIRDELGKDGEPQSSSVGIALDRQQIGARLPTGLPVCQIGDPSHLEAVLQLKQADLEFLSPGQAVWILLDQAPEQRYVAEVREITQCGLNPTSASSATAPAPQSARPWRPDALWAVSAPPAGRAAPVAAFAARCPVDVPDGSILIGATGRARVFTGHHTLAAYLYTCLRQFAQY